MKKDELVKELECLINNRNECRAAAEWAIARETAILSEIEKPLKEVHDMDNLYCKCCEDTNEAIDEALSIIQRIRGDK